MRKIILAGIGGLMIAAPAAGHMGGGSSPSMMTGAQGGLVVAMHDPGCHWFYLGGGPNHRKYALSVTRHGPVPLVNLDEAALKIKGPGGTKTQPVGGKLMLRAKGVYTITMVGQAPDDNTLKLTIK